MEKMGGDHRQRPLSAYTQQLRHVHIVTVATGRSRASKHPALTSPDSSFWFAHKAFGHPRHATLSKVCVWLLSASYLCCCSQKPLNTFLSLHIRANPLLLELVLAHQVVQTATSSQLRLKHMLLIFPLDINSISSRRGLEVTRCNVCPCPSSTSEWAAMSPPLKHTRPLAISLSRAFDENGGHGRDTPNRGGDYPGATSSVWTTCSGSVGVPEVETQSREGWVMILSRHQNVKL